jgi:HEAT repeats
MSEPVRARPDASGGRTPAILPPGPATDLAEFARTCRAAARAVSLYPGGHPAIDATLSRLAGLTARLTERGPFRVQALADRLLIDGAGLPGPDPAVGELGSLLHRHLIGSLTVNAGAGADSWRTLLLLLARTPDDVRADGGIAHLWATAGGPSIEVQEIDYAEVLREKQGLVQAIEDILSAALAGPQFEFDESLAVLVRDVLNDPAKLDALMKEIERVAGSKGPDGVADILLNLIRGMVEADAGHLDDLLDRFSEAARRLSAGGMLAFMQRRSRPEAQVGDLNVVGAVLDRMADEDAAGFVAGSVMAEHGATERLAHAFSALVPDGNRQRQVLGLARAQLATSELGDDDAFPELWQGVESMLGSYSDATFVSADYARELSNARTQPVDVDHVSDDPPERITGWLSSVGDAALHALDHALLVDLLVIESDPLRWRDMAETVVAHADDLVRVGHFDQAWQLVEGVIEQGAADPARQVHRTAALERFGRGAMMKHVAAHLRQAGDAEYGQFARLCHAIGTAVIAPLAEALSETQDAHARHRLREILIGFGPRGRESVQQLMNATNWEVRRTAAYLLREFGGAEGLKELIPLLTDPEPLVKREAVQGLVLNGSPQAAEILLEALTRGRARDREAICT